jgi:hypothetical protein
MSGVYMNELHKLYFSAHHGALTNNNGGFYQLGKSHGLEVKLLVAVKYLDHKERLGGLRPVVTQVAAKCRIWKGFVCKIERELMESGRVLTPNEIYNARDIAIGPGSKTMTEEEMFVLYQLCQAELTWSLKSYVYWMICCKGTIVLERTVLWWLNHSFPIRGRF